MRNHRPRNLDNIPGLVATMGAMGEVEFLNHQTLEYFGKTNEELKNCSLIGVVHPDDLPHVIEARRKRSKGRFMRLSTAAATLTAYTDGSKFAASQSEMGKA